MVFAVSLITVAVFADEGKEKDVIFLVVELMVVCDEA
jgi:hypothetical protein